jgi:transposase
LSAAVETVFERNLLDGHLFLFLNRRRDRIKIIWWDRDGNAIWAKRLERGNYEMPRHAETQLGLLLSGVKLDAPQRRRYVRPQALAG